MEKNKIKIIEYGALTSTKGGVESYIITQLRYINKEKIQIDFLVPDEMEKLAYEDEIIGLGSKIYRSYIRWKNSFWGHYYTLYKFFNEHKNEYDIAVGNYLDLQNINFLIMAKLFGIKICIAHAHMAGESRKNIIKYFLVKINRLLALYFCDYLWACSEVAGKWMFGKFLWNKKNKLVIKNTIDNDKYKYNELIRNRIRTSLNINDSFVIGHVGRFAEQKNHEFILEIYSKIVKKIPKSYLILIGKGKLEKKIKRRAKELKLDDKILFLGEVDNVNELLQAMDIFLFPSKHEGLPVALIEAQAAGLKVYTSKEGVSEEVKITNLVEFISLKKDSNSWADIIVKNCKYFRKDMSENIILSGYDTKTSINKLEKFYLNKERCI